MRVMLPDRPSFADDLSLTLAEALATLRDAVRDRRSPMHTPSAATIGLDGRPRNRIVVLRGFNPEERTLRFHTDIRSEKWHELVRDPRLALLFYHPEVRIQLRLEGLAEWHQDDPVADAAWTDSQAMSRHCYAVRPEPGSQLDVAGAFVLPKGRELSDEGRPNFVAILLHYHRLEWLWLGADGHRRAVFEWTDAASLNASWRVP